VFARWQAFTAAGSWRAKDSSMPKTTNVRISDVPPLDMNGNGIPVTGSNAVTYPTLINA